MPAIFIQQGYKHGDSFILRDRQSSSDLNDLSPPWVFHVSITGRFEKVNGFSSPWLFVLVSVHTSGIACHYWYSHGIVLLVLMKASSCGPGSWWRLRVIPVYPLKMKDFEHLVDDGIIHIVVIHYMRMMMVMLV